ncbi:hypothetical protein KY289_033775 [Solanum tuberosum]|nr:hypothetical protein KY289_033775 [Solanum tuberosum]
MDQANREEARNFKEPFHGGMAGMGDSVSTRVWSDDVACTRRGEAQVGAIMHKQGSPHKYGMVLHKIKEDA